MRLPYLQVTQETWGKARMLSGALGVDRHRTMSLILDLWAWGIELGPADQPPTGECISPRAARLLAGALDWTESPNDLLDALEDVGLIELIPNGLRVRGIGRYQATWTKNRRKGHGKDNPPPTQPEPAENPRGTRTGSAAHPERQTQTQIEKHIETDQLQHARAREGPPPPRHSELGFFAQFQDERAKALPQSVREKPTSDRKRGGVYAEAMLELGGDEGRLLAAVRVFFRDKWALSLDPPCPYAAFASGWRKYVPGQAQAPPAPVVACEVCGETDGYVSTAWGKTLCAGHLLELEESRKARAG